MRRLALSTLAVVMFLILCALSNNGCVEHAQKGLKDSGTILKKDTSFKHLQIFHSPDSIHFGFIKSGEDSAFTYSKYLEFLANIGDTNKFIVLPLEKFRKTFNSRKVIIGLRHDVDLDLKIASRLSKVENNAGFESSYFILHTAPYYLKDRDNMAVHNDSILPILKLMQDQFHDEIGWHNDLVTLQLVYDMDPVSFFHQELKWLRKNGINVTGTASHGSNFCYTYKYLNYYFFNECKNHIVGEFVNNDSIQVNQKQLRLKHASLKDFNLNYEAYFLNNNKYFSDAHFTNGERWHPSLLDIKSLVPGDRVIILTHPIYYKPSGSVSSELVSFNIPEQLKSIINPMDTTILLEVPAGINVSNLVPRIAVSPKATAWIGKQKLVSGISKVNFSKPLNLHIIAEDGIHHNDWTIYLKFIDTHFLVYPNPSSGMVKIELFNIIENKSRIELYNAAGQLKFSEELKGQGNFIYSRDLSGLPSGVYYFRLLTGGKQMVQPFVKK
jgi:hypothetical protein